MCYACASIHTDVYSHTNPLQGAWGHPLCSPEREARAGGRGEASTNPPGVSHDVCQSAALQKLHHNPQLIADKVAVVHVNHVFMMVISHDYNLWGRERRCVNCYKHSLTLVLTFFFAVLFSLCLVRAPLWITASLILVPTRKQNQSIYIK